jgi:hypothetical protein
LPQLLGVDVVSAIGGAAASALTLAIRSIMIAPVKAATDRARFIRLLSVVSPQRPFVGSWKVTWLVSSSRYQDENTDVVRVYSAFANVTFTTKTLMRDGSEERCVFVGRLNGRTLTGRWYDPKDEGRGYYGVFQINLHGRHKRPYRRSRGTGSKVGLVRGMQWPDGHGC